MAFVQRIDFCTSLYERFHGLAACLVGRRYVQGSRPCVVSLIHRGAQFEQSLYLLEIHAAQPSPICSLRTPLARHRSRVKGRETTFVRRVYYRAGFGECHDDRAVPCPMQGGASFKIHRLYVSACAD